MPNPKRSPGRPRIHSPWHVRITVLLEPEEAEWLARQENKTKTIQRLIQDKIRQENQKP